MTAKMHAVFVENVIEQMARMKFNRSDLARALGIAPTKVSQVLNGHEGYSNPTLELVERYADALKVEPHTLLVPKKKKRAA